MLCPSFSAVIFQDCFTFSNRGAFTAFDEFLDSKSIDASSVSDAGNKDREPDLTGEERDEFGKLEKVIHVIKLDGSGKFLAKVPQIPEASKLTFDSPKEAEKYARQLLKKNGYKEYEFEVKGSYTTEKGTNRDISVNSSGEVTTFNFTVDDGFGGTTTLK